MERDSTQEWLLPADAVPPLMSELEARIDLALATARASEEAVNEVGAAAIDAAKQARRAAESAERASAVALTLARAEPPAPAPVPRAEPPGEVDDPSLRGFIGRADRVMARLRALERGSTRGRSASALAGRRRGGT
jgi:hypothetical protein